MTDYSLLCHISLRVAKNKASVLAPSGTDRLWPQVQTEMFCESSSVCLTALLEFLGAPTWFPCDKARRHAGYEFTTRKDLCATWVDSRLDTSRWKCSIRAIIMVASPCHDVEAFIDNICSCI